MSAALSSSVFEILSFDFPVLNVPNAKVFEKNFSLGLNYYPLSQTRNSFGNATKVSFSFFLSFFFWLTFSFSIHFQKALDLGPWYLQAMRNAKGDLVGVTELSAGRLVQFHLFEDSSGLGAEEVLQA
ncbi:unnamed protein product [Durusdinium trenchii]|uniref:Uncharacterized protein n=1 Tax=Durusdinium trenchii TaxID=1381693 RepID=A0ABP0JHT9_9DINO